MGCLPVVSIPPVAIALYPGTRRRLDLLSVGRRHPIPSAPTQRCGRLRGGGATLSGRAWVSLPAPVAGPPGPGASKLAPNPRAQTRAGAIPVCLINLLLRSRMPALVRPSLDARLCGVPTQLHPRICSMPTPALDLRSLATNFMRHPGLPVQGAAAPRWRLPPAKRPAAHTPASAPRAVRKSPARKLAPANRSQAAKAAPSCARLTRAPRQRLV